MKSLFTNTKDKRISRVYNYAKLQKSETLKFQGTIQTRKRSFTDLI